MRNKRKPYPLVGFIPTEEYIEDFKKIGFEHVESTNRRDYFMHKDGSKIEYYLNGRICNHFYKFDNYKDLLRRVYDLYHVFKSNNIKPLIFFRNKKGRYPISYKTRIGKIRPSLLEVGKFLLDFRAKKTRAMWMISKEENIYYLTIFIQNIK